MDRYTKAVLTVIAIDLTVLAAGGLARVLVPDAWADMKFMDMERAVYIANEPIEVKVVGGRLDYKVDNIGLANPTLKVCANC